MARKSEVYSWRLSPDLKASLEEAARQGRRTISQVLDEIVSGHLASGLDGPDAETQRELHRKAATFAGCISGRDPRRSARAGRLVSTRLRRMRRAR